MSDSSPKLPELPSRADLREILKTCCRSSSEFEAFCTDHFFEVWQNFASGMDQITRVNLLLQHADLETLWVHLCRRYGALAEQHYRRLRGKKSHTPLDRARYQLELDLASLRSGRDVLRRYAFDVALLDNPIQVLRQKLRSGPERVEGEVLNERYRLMQRLGGGGIGTVWQAEDLQPLDEKQRIVALKILRSVQEVQRFNQSVRRMKTLLPHEHIVQILSSAMEFEGFYFFAMEYLPGGDLHTALVNKHVTSEQALDAVLDACIAIEHAHRRGVFHRDIKPDNILLTADWRGKLSDFDFAVAIDSYRDTHTGPPGGALYYAPELRSPDAARLPHPSADVYAIGMTAVFAVHGNRLTVSEREFDPFFQNQFICPPRLKEVLCKAVSLRSEDRYQSVREFREAVKRARAGLPAASAESITPVQPAEAKKRSPVAAANLPAAPPLAAGAVLGPIAAPAVPSPSQGRRLSWRYAATALTGLVIPLPLMALMGFAGFEIFRPRPARSVPPDLMPVDFSQLDSAVPLNSDLSKPALPDLGRGVAGVHPPDGAVGPPRLIRTPPTVPMVPVPSGMYPMGGENLARTVAGFAIDAHEVTVAMYAECVRAGPCKRNAAGTLCNNEGAGRDAASHPINCVSWEQADKYCKWKNKRLPTDDEWEAAARGKEGRMYPWGNEPATSRYDLCWQRVNRGTCPVMQAKSAATPSSSPGSKIYGLAGNVWEWTASRSLRGGSFQMTDADYLRASFHEDRSASAIKPSIGFRCVQ